MAANRSKNCEEQDSLTESDEFGDEAEDDFSNNSSSLTLKPPDPSLVNGTNNGTSDLISEHIYALPFPKLSNPANDTLSSKNHNNVPSSRLPVPKISESPSANLPLKKPNLASNLLHRRNTDTLTKSSSPHRNLLPRPQMSPYSNYGTNPRLVNNSDLSISPGDWSRSFGTFKKTESASHLPFNSDYSYETQSGECVESNGHVLYARGASFNDHRSIYDRCGEVVDIKADLISEPIQLLALHDNGQLRPVSFLGQQDQRAKGYRGGHEGYLPMTMDRNRRPVSMINLGSSNSAQKHLQILTQCHEVESSRENIDQLIENAVSNTNNHAKVYQQHQNTAVQDVNSKSANQDLISKSTGYIQHADTDSTPTSDALTSPDSKKRGFMETSSTSEEASEAGSSTVGSSYMSSNRFEQKYKFELNSDTEITWGSAEMTFGLQVIKEHVVNRNLYYDFRVTATEGANVNYSSPDRDFDFVTTNFPLVETKFFEAQLRRVYPTIVIPDVPQPSNNAPESNSGLLSLEIWLSWLGRHPVIGKSPIFWHMLRYAKSKDWNSQKSDIRKVSKFTRNQCRDSLIDAQLEGNLLSNYRNFLNQERQYAEAIEQKLLCLLGAVEFSLKQHHQLMKTEKFVIKSIGEEVRNFASVSKLRQHDNNACADSFSFVGHKIATCEEKVHKDWIDSTLKLRIQLQTILSAYRRLLKIFASRSLKNYVKTFHAAVKSPVLATKRPHEFNTAVLTCYTFLAELNYLKFYEIDLVFTPTYQFVKEVQNSFEEVSHDLATAFDTLKF